MKPLPSVFAALLMVASAQEPVPGPAPATPAPPATAPVPSPSFGAPSVFILCGSPGDEAHHTLFEKRLTSLRKSLTRAGLPLADIHIYYGPESAGYRGTAGRGNVQKVCAAIVEQTNAGRPAWLMVMGHANDAPGDVRFNVPGGDVSGKELAGWLKEAAKGDKAAPLNIILTTACSGRAVKHLAGPGRSIIAATDAQEGADESMFADGLVQAFESGTADTNKDGELSMTEIFLAARAAVLSTYKSQGYILTEHAGLDGDGDGRATQRPAENDATAGAKPGHALKIKSGSSS
ncbi:MAG TPA: hypothetical protein VHM91_05495 [Verrucomicrobiales bacterium]|nr:hypothetical protein [Verrucomicrobiales bacterium]